MNRKAFYQLVSMLLLLLPIVGVAQQASDRHAPVRKSGQTVVWGTVRDSMQTIPAAAVQLKKHPRTGVLAESDGSFLIRIDKGELPDTLVFSAVGYYNAYFPLTGRNDSLNLSVRLKEKSSQLKDVVIQAKKNDWKRLNRLSQARFSDELIASAIHERRFIFRITEIRSLTSTECYEVMPGLNYLVIDRDSVTICRDLSGAVYTDKKGNIQIKNYSPDFKEKVPLISYNETENEGGIRVDVRYMEPADRYGGGGGYVRADFVFPKKSGTDALVVTIGKSRYTGYVEFLGYPTVREEMLESVF